MRKALLCSCLALVSTFVVGAVGSAQFEVDNSVLPAGKGNASETENVDFGDVDLDGDWDVVMANGGDQGNDQNRIWINLGGLQAGTIGEYDDQTASRFPAVLDDSRDVELVDYDNDGDLDVHITNTAFLTNQGGRWWTNEGLLQGGSLGFYVDETAKRWVGLGGEGSSVDPGTLVGGTFISFSHDSDFGDVDNDGDLDLVYSSYGQHFNGNSPTRIFLNDGDGHFEEFNPSGFQLSGLHIFDGDPGLWCDGTHFHDTVDTTGASCDIASTATDIDLGDIDGDFDLDILHGARDELPRMFANRLDGSTLAPAVGGGALGFRDVTGAVFPPMYSVGDGHFEQEMGDMDGDGDIDILGVCWASTFGFNDVTLRNTGNGIFDDLTVLDSSAADEEEGDLFDYDNDGDLDLYFANFAGQDRLYRNDNDGGSTFSYTLVSLPAFAASAKDADCCDTDGDGDYDVLVAERAFQPNTFLRNITQTPDTNAPSLPNIESTSDRTAKKRGVPVRVHVYDNAPYYITWYNDTELLVTVDGCELPPMQAQSSAGQVFRGVLPGNLVGDVEYRFRSTDAYGNTGLSASESYTATTSLSYQASYGNGTQGSLGEPSIQCVTVPFGGTDLYVLGGNAPAGVPYVIVLTDDDLVPGVQIGSLLLLNVTGSFLSSRFGTTDANGCGVLRENIPVNLMPGLNTYAQFFTLDGVVDTWASSKGLELTSHLQQAETN